MTSEETTSNSLQNTIYKNEINLNTFKSVDISSTINLSDVSSTDTTLKSDFIKSHSILPKCNIIYNLSNQNYSEICDKITVPIRTNFRSLEKEAPCAKFLIWNKQNGCKCHSVKCFKKASKRFNKRNSKLSFWRYENCDHIYMKRCLMRGLKKLGINCFSDNYFDLDSYFIIHRKEEVFHHNELCPLNRRFPIKIVESQQKRFMTEYPANCRYKKFHEKNNDLRLQAFKECFFNKIESDCVHHYQKSYNKDCETSKFKYNITKNVNPVNKLMKYPHLKECDTLSTVIPRRSITKKYNLCPKNKSESYFALRMKSKLLNQLKTSESNVFGIEKTSDINKVKLATQVRKQIVKENFNSKIVRKRKINTIIPSCVNIKNNILAKGKNDKTNKNQEKKLLRNKGNKKLKSEVRNKLGLIADKKDDRSDIKNKKIKVKNEFEKEPLANVLQNSIHKDSYDKDIKSSSKLSNNILETRKEKDDVEGLDEKMISRKRNKTDKNSEISDIQEVLDQDLVGKRIQNKVKKQGKNAFVNEIIDSEGIVEDLEKDIIYDPQKPNESVLTKVIAEKSYRVSETNKIHSSKEKIDEEEVDVFDTLKNNIIGKDINYLVPDLMNSGIKISDKVSETSEIHLHIDDELVNSNMNLSVEEKDAKKTDSITGIIKINNQISNKSEVQNDIAAEFEKRKSDLSIILGKETKEDLENNQGNYSIVGVKKIEKASEASQINCYTDEKMGEEIVELPINVKIEGRESYTDNFEINSAVKPIKLSYQISETCELHMQIENEFVEDIIDLSISLVENVEENFTYKFGNDVLVEYIQKDDDLLKTRETKKYIPNFSITNSSEKQTLEKESNGLEIPLMMKDKENKNYAKEIIEIFHETKEDSSTKIVDLDIIYKFQKENTKGFPSEVQSNNERDEATRSCNLSEINEICQKTKDESLIENLEMKKTQNIVKDQEIVIFDSLISKDKNIISNHRVSDTNEKNRNTDVQNIEITSVNKQTKKEKDIKKNLSQKSLKKLYPEKRVSNKLDKLNNQLNYAKENDKTSFDSRSPLNQAANRVKNKQEQHKENIAFKNIEVSLSDRLVNDTPDNILSNKKKKEKIESRVDIRNPKLVEEMSEEKELLVPIKSKRTYISKSKILSKTQYDKISNVGDRFKSINVFRGGKYYKPISCKISTFPKIIPLKSMKELAGQFKCLPNNSMKYSSYCPNQNDEHRFIPGKTSCNCNLKVPLYSKMKSCCLAPTNYRSQPVKRLPLLNKLIYGISPNSKLNGERFSSSEYNNKSKVMCNFPGMFDIKCLLNPRECARNISKTNVRLN